jgi:hypothetical protein
MQGVPRCTGYCHDLGQPCKTEGWSCSWSVTAGALHIWTPDNQELADQCPRQTRPGTIPGSRNKERNRRATATRHLATPIPPGYPVYPTYPYPYPAPPPKTNWWAVVSFVLGLVGVIVLSVVCGIVALSQAKRGGGGRGLAIAGLVLSGLWMLPFMAHCGDFAAAERVDQRLSRSAAPPRISSLVWRRPRGEPPRGAGHRQARSVGRTPRRPARASRLPGPVRCPARSG